MPIQRSSVFKSQVPGGATIASNYTSTAVDSPDKVDTTTNEQLATNTSAAHGPSAVGQWGQIGGKINKLQSLGDAMLQVNSSRPLQVATTKIEHSEEDSAEDVESGGHLKQHDADHIVSAQHAEMTKLKQELAAAQLEVTRLLRWQEAEAKAKTKQLLALVEERKRDAQTHHVVQTEDKEVEDICRNASAEFHKAQVVALQGQLNEVRDELNSAIVKSEMQAMDHEQEMKRVKWEHELERNRLQWDHEQETDRFAWDHKQTMMRVMPTAQKTQKELEQVTARLLDSQEDMRTLQAKLEGSERQHKLEIVRCQVRMMELTKEHDDEREQWEEKFSTHGVDACVSPTKSAVCNICMDKAVKLVFPCGHAKCTECASRLVGLDQGCPDCRAPLGQPQLLFLSVG